jgi:hypothetical protein
MKTGKVIVGVIFVFVLGLIAGALVTRQVYRHRIDQFIEGGPQAVAEFIVERLTHELKLDGAQREHLRTIVEKARSEIREVRRQIKPHIDEIRDHAVNEIRSMLKPEQVQKFNELVAERREKWSTWGIEER